MDFNDEQLPTANRVVRRAEKMFADLGQPKPRVAIFMGLSATHHQLPFGLHELLKANDQRFASEMLEHCGHLN